MYDALCNWLMHCDRIGADTIKVPRAHIEAAIRQAAKDEGRELDRMPMETGDEYEERIKHVLR
jgi:hypothetical protein